MVALLVERPPPRAKRRRAAASSSSFRLPLVDVSVAADASAFGNPAVESVVPLQAQDVRGWCGSCFLWLRHPV